MQRDSPDCLPTESVSAAYVLGTTANAGADVRQAFERAEELAAAGRWQDVRVALAPHAERLARLPRALLLLGDALARLHDVEPALHHAERALGLLLADGDAEGAMKARNLLGIIHFETGNLEAALGHFLAALQIAYDCGEHRMCARLTNNLGTICGLRGAHEEAIEHYREALRIYEQLADTLGQSQTLHNLGITYRDLDRADEADRSFTRAARTAQAAGDQKLVGLAVVARAELLLRRGELAAAERMARMALLRFDVHSSLFGLAEAHKVLGVSARQRGDAEAARSNLDKALDYCALHAGPLLEAETRLERGVLLRDQGEPTAARDDFAAAAALFTQLGAAAQADVARRLLEEIEETCGVGGAPV